MEDSNWEVEGVAAYYFGVYIECICTSCFSIQVKQIIVFISLFFLDKISA